jgi:hypothetical protein
MYRHINLFTGPQCNIAGIGKNGQNPQCIVHGGKSWGIVVPDNCDFQLWSGENCECSSTELSSITGCRINVPFGSISVVCG